MKYRYFISYIAIDDSNDKYYGSTHVDTSTKIQSIEHIRDIERGLEKEISKKAIIFNYKRM